MAVSDPQLLNVNTMEGNYLDFAVVAALGLEVSYDGKTAVGSLENGAAIALVGDPEKSPFLRSFCREWSVGGPLIEHYGINLVWENNTWTATFCHLSAHGATPLLAAMRALVNYSSCVDCSLQSFTDLTRLEALQQIYRRPREASQKTATSPSASTASASLKSGDTDG